MREYQLEDFTKMMSVGLDLEEGRTGQNEGLITVNIFNLIKYVNSIHFY